MIHQRAVIVLWAAVLGCLALASPQACEVKLSVQNKSSATIIAVEYRPSGSETWSSNLISGSVGPHGDQVVAWSGDGDLDLGIRFTDATAPRVVPARDICSKSELIANPGGIVIR